MTSGCATSGYNLMKVKAKKFSYRPLISCEDCEIELQRITKRDFTDKNTEE